VLQVIIWKLIKIIENKKNIALSSPLSICIFIPLRQITQSINRLLSGDRYRLTKITTPQKLRNFVQENKEQIDCLIILNDPPYVSIMNEFYEQGILLPVIIVEPEDSSPDLTSCENQNQQNISLKIPSESPKYLYHNAEVRLSLRQLEELPTLIDRAITQFLHLGPSCSLSEKANSQIMPKKTEDKQSFLLLQQRRLGEKLKERLGYLGVYYKRDPKVFYRHLSQQEKNELSKQLSQHYQEIILNYFNQETDINQEIDQFVNRVFFADMSVSQILEIHMELMDAFSQKLKLEGRSEEILLDYRLTLIDIIAHLCEMYRRCIPREDLPFDVLFPID
jgi:circadian clock protein KaiA